MMNETELRNLRTAFGSFMTGVTVVTTRAPDDTLLGFTANSFTSVSLDPPLLLVCPGKHLSSIDIFKNSENFTVNVLAEGQERVANIFATSHYDRFSKINWYEDGGGCPVIADTAAHFSCSKFQVIEAGDHIILMGKIIEFQCSGKRGLGYCNNGYFSLGNERRSEALAVQKGTSIIGAIVEHDNCIYVENTRGRKSLPTIILTNKIGARDTIRQHLKSLGIRAQIGPVYSIYDDEENHEHFRFFRTKVIDMDADLNTNLVPISKLQICNWNSPAQHTMMTRYREERQNNVFGLYLGNAISGEVHIAEPADERN